MRHATEGRSDARLGWGALLVLAVSCSSARQSPAPVQPPTAEVTLQNVTVRTYRGSEEHLVGHAPVLWLHREGGDFEARDAGLMLKTTSVTMAAQTVLGNVSAQGVTGEGVSMLTRDGVHGESPRVIYDRSLGLQGGATGDAGVRLWNERFSLTAEAFTADFNDERAQFEGAVTRTPGPPAR
jgi:hypothetical protein